jgi:hypothetical protein
MIERNADSGLFPYGTEIDYFCIGGLKFDDGQRTKSVSCLGNGQWSQTRISCSGKLNGGLLEPTTPVRPLILTDTFLYVHDTGCIQYNIG